MSGEWLTTKKGYQSAQDTHSWQRRVICHVRISHRILIGVGSPARSLARARLRSNIGVDYLWFWLLPWAASECSRAVLA